MQRQKNGKYISPDIQNQLINIIGEDILQAKLIDEVRQANIYSIMADEVTAHNKEQLSICLRFVDNENNVCVEFLGFVSVIRITGKALACTLLTTLRNAGLPVENLRGQGYDGAASMSSNTVGVQARIRKEAPLAVYTHCSSHCLNLVLAHASALTPVRNMLDKLKETSLFFNSSPKCEALLSSIIRTCNPHDTSRRKSLLDLCKTRWAERHRAYQHFYQAYIYIVKCLEVIAHGLHNDEGFDADLAQNGNWDRNSKARASSLLNSLCDFQFIVTFTTVYKLLSRLHGVTVLLQKEASDIVSAVSMIDGVKEEYKEIRNYFDSYFEGVYQHAVSVAASVGTEPTVPRVAKNQMHRDNAVSSSPLQYYLRNTAIPFIDHIIAELDSQFSDVSKKASKLLALVPSVFLTKDIGYEDIKACAELYDDDLPCPEVLEEELIGWQMKFKKLPDSAQIPNNCADALKQCNEVQFPNIFYSSQDRLCHSCDILHL
ncbi:52 kDa repressor of the inhibitor of the protein kinase-like [Gigantopelta aegis]|uniref:52 kDa repressor of the inhibitor of the protein kinase-like n=1 Tax=Gigantopelta aegis TaxID=1735272 RepID=UPI001B88AF03|nr:52 kDa repressor of the inhibitor of the protein kinase-like [Gigantopelta aegis]